MYNIYLYAVFSYYFVHEKHAFLFLVFHFMSVQIEKVDVVYTGKFNKKLVTTFIRIYISSKANKFIYNNHNNNEQHTFFYP